MTARSMMTPMIAAVGTSLLLDGHNGAMMRRLGRMRLGRRCAAAPEKRKPPPEGGRGDMRRFVLAALLLAGCASPSVTPTPVSHALEGTILLTDFSSWYPWTLDTPCNGHGGYSDIAGGADVVVRNETGAIIATSSLRSGSLVGNGQCEFGFTVGGIPDAPFYAIEVSHRGELTYSAAEMETMDWRVALTLGD